MPSAKRIQRERRKQRTRARVQGTAAVPRLSLFRSNKHLYCQLVDDMQSKVVAAVSDVQLKAKGKEVPRLLGKAIAEKALQLGVSKALFDRSGYKYHGNVKGVAEGAREAGLQI